LAWRQPDDHGKGRYEAINVADNVDFVDATFASRPRDAWTFIINSGTRRVLSIVSHVREEKVEGEPFRSRKDRGSGL
jgi:hypothetical protein